MYFPYLTCLRPGINCFSGALISFTVEFRNQIVKLPVLIFTGVSLFIAPFSRKSKQGNIYIFKNTDISKLNPHHRIFPDLSHFNCILYPTKNSASKKHQYIYSFSSCYNTKKYFQNHYINITISNKPTQEN